MMSSVQATPGLQADSLMHTLHRVRGMVGSPARAQHAQEAVPYSPPCRLRLEGENSPEASCEILELSAEGVNIVISGSTSFRKGQHGRLLIGPPEGDHYELPVDVSWVKPTTSVAVLGLHLCTPPNWRFARS